MKEIIKKRMFSLMGFLFCLAMSAGAQEKVAGVSVIHEVDTVWNFGYKGVNLASRNMHRIDIAYTSKDLDGNDVLLSGYVCIPQDILDGSQPCDGILLYQHYTQTSYDCAPTRGYAIGEDMVMANPLKPNYIVVCSDYLGFGVNEGKGKGQAFCFSDINGQASIDCLLAARKLLDHRQISQGKFLINAGYSSGGFDAIATQRVRDMKYRDVIKFDKTFVGGMPFDIMEACNAFIEEKDKVGYDPTCLPMVLDMLNRHGNLGFSYEQMFKEPLASNYYECFLSGKVPMEDVMNKVKGKCLSDLVQDDFLNKKSEAFKKVKALVEKNSLANGWIPDSAQHYYSMHVLRDSVVPVQAGRAFIKFLNGYTYYNGKKCQGFTKSIVPERTRLQTNYFLPVGQHTLIGGIVYYIALASNLTAIPVLYYDGELNTHYADFVEPATLMGIIKGLEAKGFDVKGAVKKLMEGSGTSSSGGIFGMLAQLEDRLKKMGTSTAEVLQILSDSGVELSDVIQVYTYLTTDTSTANSLNLTAEGTNEPLKTDEPLLTGFYQQYLYNWLEQNNVNIFGEGIKD